MRLILQSIWFLLPGLIANMTPVFVQRVSFLNYPVDGGYIFRGKPLFGSHKTYRGFFFGILASIVISLLQRAGTNCSEYLRTLALIDYTAYSPVVVGFLLGFGALFGDLVKSFFKRRINIPSGKSWYVFDQIDYGVGMLLFVSPLFIPTLLQAVVMIAVSGILSLLSSYIGFLLKLKDEKI